MTFPYWFWFPALIGALLIPGCGEHRAPRPTSIDSTLPDTERLTLADDSTPEPVAPRALAAPRARSDTLNQTDTVQTVGVDTTATGLTPWTSDSITARRQITTVKVQKGPIVPLPEIVTRGFPTGVFNLPPDKLCAGLGYNLTVFPIIRSSVLADLTRVKGCRGRAIVQFPRRIMQRGINEDVFKVGAWLRDSVPAGFCGFVNDSTVLGLWTGDDVAKTTEWTRGTYAEQLARWDSLALMAKQKCPGVLTILRARPSQMTDRPREGRPDSLKWRWTDAAWSQYSGWRQAGDVRAYYPREDSVARTLGIGNGHGLNLLSGGCGPDPARCPTIDGVKVKGINIAGNQPDKWEMSADEYERFGRAAILAPYGCVFTGWAWGEKWGSTFHQRADNIAVAKALAPVAASHPSTSCTRR